MQDNCEILLVGAAHLVAGLIAANPWGVVAVAVGLPATECGSAWFKNVSVI
jgi:hypothetical protein